MVLLRCLKDLHLPRDLGDQYLQFVHLDLLVQDYLLVQKDPVDLVDQVDLQLHPRFQDHLVDLEGLDLL